jgi:glycosyltransferase involved in cell wall biosynthesis
MNLLKQNNKPDISIVLGSKNRKNLLKATIKSIRENGFHGSIEIIVIDGGSTDGSCEWLAKQKDIFTIIQPNYSIVDQDGIKIRAHSWGKFMNIGFKYAHSDYIVMVSDDLILAKGCLQNGFDKLNFLRNNGEKIGAAAFYFREYPRHDYYRIGHTPGDYIILNHGFYVKEALESVGYLDEINYNFYCADGDVIIRMNNSGWKSIALDDCFAVHLCHKPMFKKNIPLWQIRDINVFKKKYPSKINKEYDIVKNNLKINLSSFIFSAPMNVLLGFVLRIWDKIEK